MTKELKIKNKMKKENITFAQAINNGLEQAMTLDKDVYVIGQLVDYSPGVFGTTIGLVEKFGKERVQDFPVAESLMTSMSVGMALKKKKNCFSSSQNGLYVIFNGRNSELDLTMEV